MNFKVALPGQNQWLDNVRTVPVSFCLPSLPPLEYGYSANTFISTFQAGKRKAPGVRDNVRIRKATLAQKPLRGLLLKPHWPEPNHMAIDSCRRGQSNYSDNPNFELEAITAWGCLCREQGKNGSHIATGSICLILHL